MAIVYASNRIDDPSVVYYQASTPWESYEFSEYYDCEFVLDALPNNGKIVYSDNTGDLGVSDVSFVGRPYSGVIDQYGYLITEPKIHHDTFNSGEIDSIKIKWEVNYGPNSNARLLSGTFDFDLINLHNCRSEEERDNAIMAAIKEQILEAVQKFGTIDYMVNK